MAALLHLSLQVGQVTEFTCQMCHELPLTEILPSPCTKRAPAQQPLTSQEGRTHREIGGGWFSSRSVVPGFFSSFRPGQSLVLAMQHAGKASHLLFLNHYLLQLQRELRHQHSKKAKCCSTRDFLPLLPDLVFRQGTRRRQSSQCKKV